MPVYLYRVINADGSDGEAFEIEQTAAEPTLVAHPTTGAPVRRAFTAPNLVTRYAEATMRARATDKASLERNGFTRYERDKLTGRYHRTAGIDKAAPEIIDPRALD